MSSASTVPVIAIDGPSASGKGTIAQAVARCLGFHYLDSGALYRAVAYGALRQGVDLHDEARLRAICEAVDLRFENEQVRYADRDITEAIRAEEVSAAASKVAALPLVRQALLHKQRSFRRPPGLVAEGRDMGSVVFPDAALKLFLTANARVRAERRYKQLMDKGITANMPDLIKNIEERDARDAQRAVAPLKQMPDTRVLDTSTLTIDEVVDAVVKRYANLGHS